MHFGTIALPLTSSCAWPSADCFRLPCPVTRQAVWAFPGLVDYYECFILHYATVAALDGFDLQMPSTVCNIWNAETEVAFQQLMKIPVLGVHGWFFKAISVADWCFKVRAILSQADHQGEEHPIIYAGQKLLPTETKYLTVEKECLANLYFLWIWLEPPTTFDVTKIGQLLFLISAFTVRPTNLKTFRYSFQLWLKTMISSMYSQAKSW